MVPKLGPEIVRETVADKRLATERGVRATTDEIGAAVRSYRTTTKPTKRDLRP